MPPCTPVWWKSGSQNGGRQHREGGEQANQPDHGAPWGEAENVGWHIENARAEVDPCTGSGVGCVLLGRLRDEHGDGEEDQRLEVIVHGALQTTRSTCQHDWIVTRPSGFFGPTCATEVAE